MLLYYIVCQPRCQVLYYVLQQKNINGVTLIQVRYRILSSGHSRHSYYAHMTSRLCINCQRYLILTIYQHKPAANYLMSLFSNFCWKNFYPRDAMLAWVFVTATCLSVRLSITCRYYFKTKKATVMISSPSGVMILVF